MLPAASAGGEPPARIDALLLERVHTTTATGPTLEDDWTALLLASPPAAAPAAPEDAERNS